KQATRTLPKLTLRPEVLRLYLASSTWVLGTGLDLLGAVLMIAAFAQAPVSVVQPVSAVGLERLRPAEWLSACIAFAGVLGLGV
ncbi:probable magnesium transporter, partial [Haematococcus lacustris]